jgi:hypothetical protein
MVIGFGFLEIGLPRRPQRSMQKVSFALKFWSLKTENTVSAPGATFCCTEPALATTILSFVVLPCVSRPSMCLACPFASSHYPPSAPFRSGDAEIIAQKHAAELQVNNKARPSFQS